MNRSTHIRILLPLSWLAASALLSACGGGGGGGDDPATTFSISGTVTAAANTAVDSDVNDDTTVPVSNDSPADAQDIPNPVTLGGHVNEPGLASAGATATDGDTIDYYRVALGAGQGVTLSIASSDPANDDLDLCLFAVSAPSVPIDCSESTSSIESLTIPTDDEYLITVAISEPALANDAHTAASAYVLVISQTLVSSAQVAGMRLSDAFVPGQMIVRLDTKTVRASGTADPEAVVASLGMRRIGGQTGRNMLVSIAGSAAMAHTAGVAQRGTWLQFTSERLRAKHETLMAIKRVRRQAGVTHVFPNYVVRSSRIPDDPLFDAQWHYTQIELPAAWDNTTGSAAVIVAVIDSGVDLTHEDLSGKLVSGFDFISDITISQDGDGIDDNPDDPGDDDAGIAYHGTHVAGIVGAATNNDLGVAGAGWDTLVMPVRVLGEDGLGTFFDVEQAVRFAAGLENDSGTRPANTADVINMSFGGPSLPDDGDFQGLIDTVRQLGVIVVAAAGNDASSEPVFPAALDGVVAVSAVAQDKEKASYSNFGPTIDIAAPGGDTDSGVQSTLGDSTYGLRIGTSMATAHVSGVVALMKAIHSGLTPGEFDQVLANGVITDDLGTLGRDDIYGYGLINASKAVAAATDLLNGVVPTLDPIAVADPSFLNFGETLTELELTLSNGGDGTVVVDAITTQLSDLLAELADSANAAISSTALQVDADGLGSYRVSLERGSLPEGTYTATLRVDTTNTAEGGEPVSASLDVPLIFEIAPATPVAADAGKQHVLLIANATQETIQEESVAAEDGLYSFVFSGVAEGDYLVVSGSDVDNDGSICDPGESCGTYRALDSVTIISVSDRDITGIDFETDFNPNLLLPTTERGAAGQSPLVRIIQHRSLPPR